MKSKFTQVNPDDRKLTITNERMKFIYECAIKNEMLDGSFGDEECVLWSLFRRAYRIGNESDYAI